MSNPIVSVVIPTYNRAALLERALKCVGAQTYRDYEIVVADDGSDDATDEVVNRYALSSCGERVRYLRLGRGGPAAARNAGIRQSAGQLIAFLDSDDEWLPNHLEVCVRRFNEADRPGMVFTDHFIKSNTLVRTRVPTGWTHGSMARDIILRRAVIATPAVVVARDALDQVGLFNETLVGTEDWELWVRLALARLVVYVSEATVVIHQHPGNFSARPEFVAGQIRDAVEVISAMDLAPFCTSRQVRARGHLDTAAVYAASRARARAFDGLARAAVIDPAGLLSMATLRTALLASLGPRTYESLRRLKKGASTRKG